MPTEPWNEYSNQISTQIRRFELMVKRNQLHFIDIDEMEMVISHYVDIFQFDKALIALNIGISQHPYSATLLLWKSQILISQNKINEAIEILIMVEVLEPANSEMFLLKGIINSRKEHHEEAIKCFKKAIEFTDGPDNEPYLEIAEEYKISGKYKEAKDALERALEMDPSNTETMLELAMCCDILKDFKRSVEFYELILDEDPYAYLNWFNLGLAYFNLAKIEKSIEAFDFTIAIKEDFTSAYFSKACSLTSINKYEEAIEFYKET
ncbi:MAG: tetratricopeptide repeat protein [Bacteroidetes bacterium]|nr:tetratricopeptide repeat protein [Bacteroidota bacterium]